MSLIFHRKSHKARMRWFSPPVVQITRIIPFLHSYVSDWYPGVRWAFAIEIILIISLFLSLQSIGETTMIDILFFYCPNGMPLHEGLSERSVSNLLNSGEEVMHVAIQISSTSSFSISPTWIYSCFLGMQSLRTVNDNRERGNALEW